MQESQLMALYSQIDSEYSNINQLYELIEKFVVPFRGQFYGSAGTELEFDWRKRDLYDDTAVDAAICLASNLHSGLTNPSIVWFLLASGEPGLDTVGAIRGWFQELTKQVYYLYQTSNFNIEVGEAYLDCVSFGMTYLIQEAVETDDGRLDKVVFSTVPAPEARVEFDFLGNVQYFFRRHSWNIRKIVSKFGAENIPEALKKKWKEDQEKPSEEEFEIIFCIYPRKVPVVPVLETKTVKPELRPFGFKYVWAKTKEMVGKEGGYYDMPVFAPKWKGAVGSRFGYSPAFVCLSSILSLNELNKLIFKALEKAVDPPLLVSRRGVFGDISLISGGQTVVSDPSKAVATLESKARFDAGHMSKEDLRAMVRSAYFMDQLQLKQSPAMTATEVHARMELMQRLMGPSLNRLQFNMLTPSIMRSVRTLLRYGVVEAAPPQLMTHGRMDIKYLGTAARAQMTEDAMAIERWMSGLITMAGVKPQVMDNINDDEAARQMAKSLGVPATVVNDKSAVTSIRKKREADMQEMREAEKAQAAGAGMKAVGEGRQAMRVANG